MKGDRIILAAHRGDRAAHPENTMPAFKSSLEFGCDMIETDIRMTLDGELVLIHDRSTLRTSGVDKNVDELTLSELREINVGATFGDGKEFVPVPTVREFMELIKDTNMLVNWELKAYPSRYGDEVAFGIVDKLVDMIYEYGLEERSMINSFSDRVIEYAKIKHGSQFPIHGQGISACARSHDEPDTMTREELYDWCCLYPNEKGEGRTALNDPENFEYCIEHGILPCICIKDELENYRKAIELGCKMFTTNNIYECDKILRELGVR